MTSASRPWTGRAVRWIAAAVVVLTLGAWWVSAALGGNDDVEWTEARRGDLVLGIEVTGTLRAVDTVLVGPPQLRDFWEYKIAHMAPEGQEVEQGTPVLGFDTSELQQRLQRQQAEAAEAAKQIEKTETDLVLARRQDALRLAEARGRKRKAELKVDRPEQLAKAKELAEARYDLELATTELAYLEERLVASKRSAEASLAALHNQQARAESLVSEIQRAIEEMMIPAARAGTVIYVTNWRGDKKKVGDSCWRGESVIELPDLNLMRADGQVDEADAGRLAEGQSVKLRLDAHPDDEFTGKVQSIWKTVQRESWRSPEKVARLEVALDETDRRKMRPGMRFRGKVELERVEDTLLVPVDAVFLQDQGPVVYRRTTFGFDTVPVELGRRDERQVEVLSGLETGARIALSDLGAERRGA